MAPWEAHPVAGPIIGAVEMIVAGNFAGLMSLSQARLAEPEPDPVWRSGAIQAGVMTRQFDIAREQLLITSPELFEPAPRVSSRLAGEACRPPM